MKSKLINHKILCRILGQLVLIESIMMALSLAVGIIYQEQDHAPFIISLVVTLVLGVVLWVSGLRSGKSINRRESYLIVGLTWVVFSVLGTLPLLIGGHCSSVGTAFFESMSGFTTTGASVLQNIDSLPHSILFWRSIMHWIGGLGIVFFTMTILPTSDSGETQLFAAESTGLGQEKLHSKIRTTAAWIWSIYIFLTLTCGFSLWAAGMSLFDAVNQAMSIISTGGFCTHGDLTGFYHSAVIEYVMIVFMLLGGVNFYMLYTVGTKRTLRPIRNNSELRFYLGLVLGISLACGLCLFVYNGYDLERALRTALFNCVSINTTTGITSDNYQLWYQPTMLLVMFLMFAGASSGSTTGGFKSIRMLIILKTTRIQFKRLLHPNAIIPIYINRGPINQGAERNVMTLLFWFLFMIVAGGAALMCVGIDGFDSLSVSLASVCNIGTNFGHTYGPDAGLASLPEAGKWICSFLMLAGRLEIFAILLPLTRSFWRRQ